MRHRAKIPGMAVAFAAAAAMLHAVAGAQAADAADQAAVRAAIVRQMDAFKHDDAGGAYGFASSAIKALFPTAAGFLAMVRDQYGPVYRPKSMAFGELKTTDAGLMQTVAIIDAEGQAWTAVYSFSKDADGQWRISGCALIKVPETDA
jgi:hypothetical protein